MQFTDLVLGVLAQFPESPGGCHLDWRKGEEHHGRLRNRVRSDGQSGACGAGTRKRPAEALKRSLVTSPLRHRRHTPASEISVCCHRSVYQVVSGGKNCSGKTLRHVLEHYAVLEKAKCNN